MDAPGIVVTVVEEILHVELTKVLQEIADKHHIRITDLRANWDWGPIGSDKQVSNITLTTESGL